MTDRGLLESLRRQAGSAASPEERAERIADLIRLHTGRRWVGIYRLEAGEVINLAWSGPAAPAYPRFPADQGLTGEVIRSGRTVICNDVANDPRYLTALATTGSELIVPVFADGQVVGTLDVEDARIGAFDHGDQALLESLAAALTDLHTKPDRLGGQRMRLPNTAHTSRPWRIHELTRDFRLEDVWALPTPGRRDDFTLLVQGIASADPSRGSSRTARALWAIRRKVGKLLGWDGPDAGLGTRVPTLRDRLPPDLQEVPSGPDFAALPFSSLYLLADEWAAEIANRTVHGVMHVGWVPDGSGGYCGQMAVLVKPNGLLGISYLAAIRPSRHRIVYPLMLRQFERAWQARTGEPTAAR